MPAKVEWSNQLDSARRNNLHAQLQRRRYGGWCYSNAGCGYGVGSLLQRTRHLFDLGGIPSRHNSVTFPDQQRDQHRGPGFFDSDSASTRISNSPSGWRLAWVRPSTTASTIRTSASRSIPSARITSVRFFNTVAPLNGPRLVRGRPAFGTHHPGQAGFLNHFQSASLLLFGSPSGPPFCLAEAVMEAPGGRISMAIPVALSGSREQNYTRNWMLRI